VSSSQAGQASVKKALIAAVAKSGKLDDLIAELERRKARTARYRAKRAAACSGGDGITVSISLC
jgi:hypothetical protein